MSRLTVQLLGYFDNNFGDDYMMKLIACRLPEIDFVIDKNQRVNPILTELPNVFLREVTKRQRYPKLLVTGSGFMLNSNSAVKSELINLLKGRSYADYCLGCNMEPLDSSFKKWLIKRKLNKFKLIVCRDKKSFSEVSENVRNTKVMYLPDILFSMPDATLVRKPDADKLGIAMMHRSGDTQTCDYYKSMAELADYWIEKTEKNTILMAFDSGEENDVYSCECVKKLSSHPEKIEIVIHTNGTEIPQAYAECSKIVGARFHSAVLALRFGIPFYPIIFREKMKNLLEDLSYPVLGCKIDNIELDNIKNFLSSEIQYDLNDSIITDSTKYAQVFKESLNKDSDK